VVDTAEACGGCGFVLGAGPVVRECPRCRSPLVMLAWRLCLHCGSTAAGCFCARALIPSNPRHAPATLAAMREDAKRWHRENAAGSRGFSDQDARTALDYACARIVGLIAEVERLDAVARRREPDPDPGEHEQPQQLCCLVCGRPLARFVGPGAARGWTCPTCNPDDDLARTADAVLQP